MNVDEAPRDSKEENLDPVGVEIQKNDYPIVNLFKIINVVVLLLFVLFYMWVADSSFIRNAISVLSMALGGASLLIPAKKNRAKKFRLLSVFMYVGIVIYVIS